MTKIIVGMDESVGAADALRWAVCEGADREWDITALLAWSFLDHYQLEASHDFDPDHHDKVARRELTELVVKTVGDDAADRIGQEVVCDLAATALIERSATADLLVVGARGLGGFKSLLMGSVSDQCLHHAKCPVAVVRAGTEPIRHLTERIVVGIDGSPASRKALRWALAMARTSHGTVEVVHAWQPILAGGPFALLPVDPSVLAEAAERTLEEVLAAEDTTGVDIARNLVCGSASTTILDVARDADLVVVGSRGVGGFAGMLLGSVSRQVAHHAPCPVVVVPPDDPR